MMRKDLESILRIDTKKFSNLSTDETNDVLVYSMYGYSSDLAVKFGDIGGNHSPIIGWAYDGNPIYGPYGYSTRDNVQSGVGLLKSGYSLNKDKLRIDLQFQFSLKDSSLKTISIDDGDLDNIMVGSAKHRIP